MAEGIRVEGTRELLTAFIEIDRELKVGIDAELKEIGEIVARDAQERFRSYSEKSAAGIESRVKPGRVVVEQQLRKVDGSHPWWGALQMTEALLPAVEDNEPELEDRADRLVGRLIHENGF